MFGPDMEQSWQGDIKIARQGLCNFKRNVLAINRKVESIEEAISTLQEERIAAISGRNILMTGPVFDSAILPYAKAVNIALANDMLRKLPRELREMVYSALWTKDYVHSTHYNMLTILSGLSGATIPHYCQTDFVGADIAREIVESYYQYAPGRGKIYCGSEYPFTASTPRQIIQLVNHDNFNVGIEPAALLKTMRIRLYLDMLASESTGYIDLEDAHRCFLSLLDISRKERFILKIELKQKRIRFNLLYDFVSRMREILTSLVDQGAEVNLKWLYFDGVSEFDTRGILENSDIAYRESWKRDTILELDEDEDILEEDREYLYEDNADYNPATFLESEDEEDEEHEHDEVLPVESSNPVWGEYI